ncbi:patatin-like phospholipase family protein [Candidatus Auribacterota bacterium]
MTSRPKIGLVLGTGAARGIAHIGVLKAFAEHKIPIDFISGCSMGALVGAFYAAGLSVSQLEDMALNLNIKKLASLFFPSFARSGIINGAKIEELLLAAIGNKEFKDLKIPLAVITTNVHTGEEVVINQGSVIKAVRASISFPGLFVPVELGNYHLIDGGIVNPLPIAEVKKMGADLSVVVDITKDVGEYTKYVKDKKHKKAKKFKEVTSKINKILLKEEKTKNFFKSLFNNKNDSSSVDSEFSTDTKMYWTPNIINIILQTIYIMESQIGKLKLAQEKVDVVIKPDLSHIYMLEFHKTKELIQAGYKAAKKVIKEIEDKLK